MNKIKGLVSVIIPTFGGGNYLHRCIVSVLKQTYKQIEIIVVDDNGLGTENQLKTACIIEKYKNDSRVKYVCHKKNINGSAARNTGVKYSCGEYIALLDDDDEYYPTKIEVLVEEIEKLSEEYALVFGNAYGYDGDKKVYSNKAHTTKNDLYNILLHRFSIGTSAFLIRRSAYDHVGGFDEDFKRHQDWEFFCKVIANYKIKAINTPASIRHITRRHSPKSVDVALEYRKFYLMKMEPYIKTLSSKEQNDVRIYNILDVLIKYLYQKRIKDFLRYYIELKPGYRGVLFFFRRLFLVIERGSIKGKQ